MSKTKTIMNVQGALSFKGDKSLSHRAAIFAAMAEGVSEIRNYLNAEDTLNTIKVIEALGCTVEKNSATAFTVSSPGIQKWNKEPGTLDVGNSGTGARLLLGLLAGYPGMKASLDGDASLRKRPMKRVTKPLSKIGAKFSGDDKLPIEVHGQKLKDIEFTEELGSAQVKSAMILAAIASESKLVLHEPVPSRDHTENMLNFCRVEPIIESAEKGKKITLVPPFNLKSREFKIWGDISSSAFFVVAGLLADEGELVLRNVLLNPYRDRFLNVLKRMGGQIEILTQHNQCGEAGGDIIVYPSKLHGTEILPEEIPSLIDELPILTIAGVFAGGNFSFRGAAELRVKESDRIGVMAENLRACGVQVEEFEDGLSLRGEPGRILRGQVDPRMDHRIVMSFEVASARSMANGAENPIEIKGREWVNTSFPDFFDKWSQVTKLKGSHEKSSLSDDKNDIQETGGSPMIVAVDGPAGSGKSTLATMLATKFGFYQIDSGALYRALTWLALEKSNSKDIQSYVESSDFQKYLSAPDWEVGFNEERKQYVKIKGEVCGDEIRTPQITDSIKILADNNAVRDCVNAAIRKLAHSYTPMVADGRDMGTVVFPEATFKFFVTADVKERAQRRYLEFKQKYPQISVEEVENQISKRDEDDRNRKVGALRPAQDAIFVDTTSRNIDIAIRIVTSYLRTSSHSSINDVF